MASSQSKREDPRGPRCSCKLQAGHRQVKGRHQFGCARRWWLEAKRLDAAIVEAHGLLVSREADRARGVLSGAVDLYGRHLSEAVRRG